MLVPNFPFRNKLLQTHVKSIETGCPVNCFLSRAPNRAPMRVFFLGLSCTKSCSNAFFFHGLSCTKSCSNACFFFCGLSCAKSCSNACFFLRFVVHQIVLQCVLLFAVYCAPNRAVWSQLCWKSVLLLSFFSCSENGKSVVKPKNPKTCGFVLFSSSELRPGSGRS